MMPNKKPGVERFPNRRQKKLKVNDLNGKDTTKQDKCDRQKKQI